MNGGSKGSETTEVTPANIDLVAIGADRDATPASYLDGRIAFPAIWNIALIAAEILALSKGASPTQIQPQALVHFPPFVRDADVDWMTGTKLTAGGTPTVAANPPLVQIPWL